MKRSFVAAIALVAAALAGLSGGDRGEASRAAHGGFVFGVIPQQNLNGKDFKAMRNGGITSLRLAMYWPLVQPQPGSFNWAGYDDLVAKAAREEIEVLPYLYGSPYWAARYDGFNCTEDCTKYAPASQATRDAFGYFAAEAVRQYGPGGRFWAAHPDLPYKPIDTWQIWNEQNSAKYFAPAPDVDSYTRLLGTTAIWILTTDPNAKLVLGGMWGPQDTSQVISTATYLKRLYRRENARDVFDAIGIHPYASGLEGVIDQIRAVRRVTRRSGDGRVGILVTELGWASEGPDGHHLVKGRRGQARILTETYEMLLERRREWGIDGAYWYAWKDTPDSAICLWCAGAGLRSLGGGPKPAWRSLKRVALAR